MKEQVYKDPRPAEHFTRFHERARTRRPDWVYELVRLLLTPYVALIYRGRAIDSDKVPGDGPVLLAPNHFSFLDHFFVAAYLRRKVQFMAKSQLFQPPLQWIYTHGGVFPVLRGRRDEEAFKTAHAILDRGDMVLMYLEGGRSRTGDLGEARPGVGRLALEAGVPVVPVAIFGSQNARNWKKLQFPKVTVQFGDPIRFEQVEQPTREQAQAASEVVFEDVQKLYYGLQRHGRKRAIAASRAARRAAEAAARRPVAS
ncbi:MAG TPA: lysophospholipid acyltransferase family protein [Candidatus Dormibacteraeota bacterium]|nr:lysophospholipid acyltransferase family protein [Candidatus Dormibacteraeota bacterium]